MCDPLSLTGLALGTAGTLASSSQQGKNAARVAGAVNDATADNFARVDAFQPKADAVFGDSLGVFGDSEQASRRDEAITDRNNAFERAIKTPPGLSKVSSSAPSIVGDTIARKTAEGGDKARSRGRRAARVTSLGDLLLENKIDTDRNAGRLGEISSFARGVAGLLPIERAAAANNAFKAAGPLASILKLAGTGLSFAGMAGLGPSFGSLFGSAPATGGAGGLMGDFPGTAFGTA